MNTRDKSPTVGGVGEEDGVGWWESEAVGEERSHKSRRNFVMVLFPPCE